MKTTLYIVHSDTDQGSDIKVFTTPKAEQDYCEKLMRELNRSKINTLLDSGDDEDRQEAWVEFEDRADGRWARHEVDVEIPAPQDDLLAAFEEVVRIADRDTDAFRRAHAAIAKAKGEPCQV